MKDCPEQLHAQYSDNLNWIRRADENKLVVGSKARILYADAVARGLIMQRFSEEIEKGSIKGPIVLSRDHHDVSGADSPYRETASVRDGSMFCADMSVQNFVGTAIRGATWVALHNGGGTGWGEVLNGGFGVVLVGGEAEREKLKNFMLWDVSNGVSRRSWAGGKNASFYADYLMKHFPGLQVTQP